MIGRIICWLTKHKRGTFVKCVGIGADGKTDTAVYECPRCSAQWSRKVPAKKPTERVIPESVRKSEA